MQEADDNNNGRDNPAAIPSFWPYYRAGILNTLSIPALVLLMSFVGYGALAREAGFSIFLSLFTTITVYALPGQVVLADQALHGAGIAAAALAVTLTSIRLLPLTASFMPLLREEQMPRAVAFFASHFVAVTVWVEAMRHLPLIETGRRLPYYFGLCTVLVFVAIAGTITGYFLAATVPPTVQAGLLFLTPMYFFLSLLTIASNVADRAAILLGIILGPLLFLAVPGFDLLLTGLIGGTLAYGGGRWTSLKS